MDVPFALDIDAVHASTRDCYVSVIAVTEFSPPARRIAAAAADVNDCATVSAHRR
jgi:hypothetical protein